MQDVLILSAARTPIGRLRGGLSGVRPDDLLALALGAACSRAGPGSTLIEEVFAGCANQAGEDSRNIARMATLLAGFPNTVPAMTINRLCASGLDAVIAGARTIALGERQFVVCGGVESMSRAPYSVPKSAAGFPIGNLTAWDTSLGWRYPNPRLEALFPLESMGETAENIAERYVISRADQDRFALLSHQKAVAAKESGRFDDEIIAVKAPGPKRSTLIVDADEGPRADSCIDKLAGLRPVFREGGTVTAGNSSTLNDGAAALMLGRNDSSRSRDLGAPLGRLVAWESVGVDPRFMGLGPVEATRRCLSRAGMKTSDIDLVELNEAFSAQALAVIQELNLDPDRVNVNGGAIALGHPLGCSGARILTTLVHEMRRRDAAIGLATLCVGVGQGVSVIVERV